MFVDGEEVVKFIVAWRRIYKKEYFMKEARR